MWEVMNIDRELWGSSVVVVFDSVRVFVAEHFLGDWFDVLLCDECGDVKDSNVAVLVA